MVLLHLHPAYPLLILSHRVGYAELASAVSNAGGLGIVCVPLLKNNISASDSPPPSSPLSLNPLPKTFARRSENAAQ